MIGPRMDVFLRFKCPKCKQEIEMINDHPEERPKWHWWTFLGMEMVHGKCGGTLIKTTCVAMGLKPRGKE